MVSKEARRFSREGFSGEVRLSWGDEGNRKFTMASGHDISLTGMSVKADREIPLRTRVKIECLRFSRPRYATVRNSAPKGSQYLLGFEFQD